MEYKCIFATMRLDIENGIFFAKPSGQKTETDVPW